MLLDQSLFVTPTSDYVDYVQPTNLPIFFERKSDLVSLEESSISRQVLNAVALGKVPSILIISGTPDEFSSFHMLLEKENQNIVVLDTRFNSTTDKRNLLFSVTNNRAESFGLTAEKLRHTINQEFVNGDTLVLVYSPTIRSTYFARNAIRGEIPAAPIVISHLSDERDSARATLSPRIKVHNSDMVEIQGALQPTDIVSQTMALKFVNDALVFARDQSQVKAAEILEGRKMTREDLTLPKPVYDFIQNTMVPVATAYGVPLVLRGGCANICYFDAGRPVSLDVDFTAPVGMENFEVIKNVMALLTGSTDMEIIGAPNDTQRTTRSTYAKGYVQMQAEVTDSESPGSERISVDGVCVRRVKKESFAFEFPYDAFVHSCHRTVQLDNGAEVMVVPPELSLIEKLVAARGIEMDKFDLFDSAGILANQKIDLEIVKHLIERQIFDPQIDPHLELNVQTRESLVHGLDRLGISHPCTVRAALRHYNKGDFTFFFDGENLKKLALVSRLMENLDIVDKNKDVAEPRHRNGSSPAELWGEEVLSGQINRMREYLSLFAKHLLGKDGVYVRRSNNSLRRAEQSQVWGATA